MSFPKLIPAAAAAVLFLVAPAARAGTIFSRPLPVSNLNYAAGPDRSNISFSEDDPTAAMDGDDFTLGSSKLGTRWLIQSITTWSVASAFEPLGNEFSSVSLYLRPGTVGDMNLISTGTPGTEFLGPDYTSVADSNPNITHTLVTYADGTYYEAQGAEGSYFPLWQHTFSHLNIAAAFGQDFQFAVWGTGTFLDPNSGYGYWFNHYSNTRFAGVAQQGSNGSYLGFNFLDLSGQAWGIYPAKNGNWDKGADMNILVTGVPIPEPGTAALLCLGLAGIAAGWLRRR